MTVPLTGTGGHFTRAGKEGKAFNDINTFRGNSGTIGSDWQAIFAQFASSDQVVIDRLWSQLTALQNNMSGAAKYLQTVAQATTIQMVQDDQHLDDQTLKGNMAELIRQMKVSSDKVKQPTVSVTVTTGNGVVSNTGDGVCIATVTDQTGTQTDYSFNETITAICSNDSQALTGAATLGKEPFQVTGEAFVDPITDPTWPLGSGASLSLLARTSDDSPVQATNLVANGSFESFTSSTPDNWNVDIGALTISQGSGSGAYRGAGSLKITGDGATLTTLHQSFNTGGQSTAKLAPLTIYGLNFWIKRDSGLVAGVLQISLIDGAGTILQDAAGNNLSLSITLSSGTTTSFVAHNVFFRTGPQLPQTQPAAIRIKLTTAATNTAAFYIDDIVLTPAVQLYNGGPFAAIFSGKTPFIVGDQFNLAVANDFSSAWQKIADRFWSMRDNGLILPSTAASGSVTISDSLLS
jgi:hypothetical protein